MMYLGTMIQHLVGAKLEILFGDVSHHGASVADEGTGRDADFLYGDVAIHVTTSPGEAVIRKCQANLDRGKRPIVITLATGVSVARDAAANAELSDRIEIFEVEQFVATNLHERGRFEAAGRLKAARELIDHYNAIVAEHETDPSLRIEIAD